MSTYIHAMCPQRLSAIPPFPQYQLVPPCTDLDVVSIAELRTQPLLTARNDLLGAWYTDATCPRRFRRYDVHRLTCAKALNTAALAELKLDLVWALRTLLLLLCSVLLS